MEVLCPNKTLKTWLWFANSWMRAQEVKGGLYRNLKDRQGANQGAPWDHGTASVSRRSRKKFVKHFRKGCDFMEKMQLLRSGPHLPLYDHGSLLVPSFVTSPPKVQEMASLGKDKAAGASQADSCDFGELATAMIFIYSLAGPGIPTCQHTVLVLCQTYTRSSSDSYPRVKAQFINCLFDLLDN